MATTVYQIDDKVYERILAGAATDKTPRFAYLEWEVLAVATDRESQRSARAIQVVLLRAWTDVGELRGVARYQSFTAPALDTHIALAERWFRTVPPRAHIVAQSDRR